MEDCQHRASLPSLPLSTIVVYQQSGLEPLSRPRNNDGTRSHSRQAKQIARGMCDKSEYVMYETSNFDSLLNS